MTFVLLSFNYVHVLNFVDFTLSENSMVKYKTHGTCIFIKRLFTICGAFLF